MISIKVLRESAKYSGVELQNQPEEVSHEEGKKGGGCEIEEGGFPAEFPPDDGDFREVSRDPHQDNHKDYRKDRPHPGKLTCEDGETFGTEFNRYG